MDIRNSRQVEKFAQIRPRYVAFSDSLRGLLESLVIAHDMKYHVVEARAKTVDSFSDKINRPSKSYSDPLSQIEDLCGARIICYFVDDLEKIVSIIKNEFQVISEETAHQQEKLNVDQFGYLSYHLIIKLNEIRNNLIEWREF